MAKKKRKYNTVNKDVINPYRDLMRWVSYKKDPNLLIKYQEKHIYKQNNATRKEMRKITNYYLKKLGV